MATEPYFGLTGFTTQDQITAVLSVIPQDSERLVSIGVLASLKTLRSIAHNQNRYPPKMALGLLRVRHPRAIKIIHYNTSDYGDLCRQLVDLTELSPDTRGFQLNMVWPSIIEIHKYFHKRSQYTRFILQIGRQAMEILDQNPNKIAKKIKEYGDCIDDVLIDNSGGQGRLLDIVKMRQYIRAMKDIHIIPRIGVAGGLGPGRCDVIEKLSAEFDYELNFDAEKQIRNAADDMDLRLAMTYARDGLKACTPRD